MNINLRFKEFLQGIDRRSRYLAVHGLRVVELASVRERRVGVVGELDGHLRPLLGRVHLLAVVLDARHTTQVEELKGGDDEGSSKL